VRLDRSGTSAPQKLWSMDGVVVMIERGGAAMTTPKAILIGAALISAAIIASMFLGDRYQIIQGPAVTAWKIDKLTGATWICHGSGECRPMSN